jgi:ABC-2 type transport system permease protein
MTTEAMSETLDPPASAPRALSPTRPLYWSMRRELWENRSIFIAPLIASGVVLLGFLVSAIGMPHRRLATLSLPPEQQAAVVAMPYDSAATAMILTMVAVAVFYCLGALHDERRDRSILFWKSLPVSDLKTVVAKALTPLAVMPLVFFPIIIATQLAILLLSAVILVLNGVPATAPGMFPAALATPVVLSYGMLTLSLWLAPIYGWLMLVGAWARRAPLLWAVLPPLALGAFEKLAFNSTHFLHLLGNRISGSYAAAFVVHTHDELKARGGPPSLGLADIDAGKFLSSPGLWLGIIVAVGFFAGAVWLRRRREPS